MEVLVQVIEGNLNFLLNLRPISALRFINLLGSEQGIERIKPDLI
jgi:hypothetical protein